MTSDADRRQQIAAAQTRVADADDPARGETMVVDMSAVGRSAPTVGAAAAGEGEPARGDTVGRFVILGVLGQGGMGLVYSGYDPHLDRKVAIKLLRASVLGAIDARTRLLREAQAMAKISHPNVVTVHEVGTYGEQVYVAMEFADAGTLRDWLETPRAHREIVDKFIAAGKGLAAAHAVGLVHRDFKPENVLLTTDGGVRVTDFGIVGVAGERVDGETRRAPTDDVAARASVEASLSGTTPLSQQLTRTGAVMGTPLYMPPEQFKGDIATERADQFSFCVALYEALYRERAFAGATFEQLEANVLAGNVSPAPKGSSVPGWIRRALLRGLLPEPDARYPSMTELLAALSRDPARRNRRLAGAAVVAAGAAAAVFFALGPDAAERCASGADRADRAWTAKRREALRTAFTTVGRANAAASFAHVEDILQRWDRSWAAGYTEACEATHERHAQTEALLDLRLRCLDRVLSDVRTTVDLLGAGGADAVDKALKVATELPSVTACADPAALTAAIAPPADAATREAVGTIRAQLDAARGHQRIGRYPAGLATAREALAAARTTKYRPLEAEALLVAGRLEKDAAEPTAIATLRDAMHAAAEVGDQPRQVEAAVWLVYLFATGSKSYEHGIEIGTYAESIAQHARPAPDVVVLLHCTIGLLEETHGKLAEADARYRQGLALAESTLGPDHATTISALNMLGNLAKTQGKFAEARGYLERVLASRGRVFGDDHPAYADVLNNLGNVARVEGKLDEAKDLYDRSLAIRIAALGPDHPEVGTSYNNLGTFYDELEDTDHAEEYYGKALALWEKVYGPDQPEVATALMNLGNVYVTRHDYPRARDALGRALAVLEKAVGPDHPKVAVALGNLGLVAEGEGKLDEARAHLDRATRIATAAYGPAHPDVADYLMNAANLVKRGGNLDEAEAKTLEALAAVEKAYGADHTRMGMALSNLGSLQLRRRRYAEALESYKRADAIIVANLGEDHPYISYTRVGWAAALDHLDRSDEAVPLLEQALKIRIDAGMPPGLVAEVRHELAYALTPGTKASARAVELATAAIAEYEKEGDREEADKLRRWLKAHRR
jgi:tetratricopeptide (TPR) repeat protein